MDVSLMLHTIVKEKIVQDLNLTFAWNVKKSTITERSRLPNFAMKLIRNLIKSSTNWKVLMTRPKKTWTVKDL
jgi:hypothetical protein